FILDNFAASALKEVPLEQRAQRLGGMAHQIGPLEFHSVIQASGAEVAFLGRSRKTGDWVEVGLRLEAEAPNGILGLRFEQSEGPGATRAAKQGSDAEV